MNVLKRDDSRPIVKWAIKLLSAACLVWGVASFAEADEQTKLKITAIGQPSPDAVQQGGILDGRTPRIAAAADFHDYICAYNSDGGLLTAIVDAALRQEVSEADYDVSIENGKNAFQEAKAHEDTQMSFPWYKPNCEGGTFLTDHTRSLCEEYKWSESIYDVVVGYFSAKDYKRPLRRHHDVFGTTLCVPGVEFPQMLHEVGISDLNTRIIVRKSPAACLVAVKKQEADLTLLPISMAATEAEHLDLTGEIIPHVSLDRVMSLRAIAPVSSETASDDIALLNSGLDKIRKNGEWFDLVQKFAKGHEHDHAYEKKELQNLSAVTE